MMDTDPKVLSLAMIIRNFYEDKLSQASYLVGCAATGQAIVIDPLRDIHQYLQTAASLGLRITSVTETHIHADFLSGSRELAAATGANIYLSDEGDASWKYDYANDPNVVLLHDGDVIQIGNLSLRAVHTPGHTPEHLAYVLTDHPTSSLPHSLFAGDFVFVGEVGRPDLLERAANVSGTMEKGARDLFRSLKKLQELPDFVLVWPGHGAGSACGKSLGGSPVSTLGYERRSNWAFLASNEDNFVAEILAGQPEPPRYFKEMKRLNKEGPAVLHGLPRLNRIGNVESQLIDTRPAEDIRAGNYQGAVAIPAGKSFTGWAGWVVGYAEPLTLISESQSLADGIARDLATIGIDAVAGWIHPSDLDRAKFAPIQTVSAEEFDDTAVILDVRGANERKASQIPGSIHIPFGYLADRVDELPKHRRVLVHCASGGRSPIAYSILRRAGFTDVWELAGGISALQGNRPELVAIA